MPKLSQRTIDNRSRPAKGQEIIREDDLPGFGVRFTRNSASYVVECRLNGKNTRRTIGKTSILTLDEARKQARQMLALMAAGVDPAAQKRQERFASITLHEVLETYLATKQLKKSTVSCYRRMVNNAFRDWIDKPITAITRDMVSDRHREMANGVCRGGNSGRAYANGCFQTLQAMINFAAEKYEVDGQPLIRSNPVARLTKTGAWYRVHPRTGVVPEYKLAAWYKAVKAVKNRTVSDYFLLLLFTGIRRREGTASGLNLTLYRAYSASRCRWLSRDPDGEQSAISLYCYVANRPIAFLDPFGLSSTPCCSQKPQRQYCRSLACCQEERTNCLRQCDRLFEEGCIKDVTQCRRCRRCCFYKYEGPDQCVQTVLNHHQYDIANFHWCWEQAMLGALTDEFDPPLGK